MEHITMSPEFSETNPLGKTEPEGGLPRMAYGRSPVRRSLGVTCVLLLIMIPALNAELSKGRSGDPDPVREQIRQATASALPGWLEVIGLDRHDEFGFAAPDEMKRAAPLAPIPFVTPERNADSLKRARIERALDTPPTMWLVPVGVDGRIACLAIVEKQPGSPPVAVEFGKLFAARRLAAGLGALGSPEESRWSELRLLSFVGPNLDLLLFRTNGESWKWVKLTGTAKPRAEVLDSGAISALLATLSDPMNEAVP